MHYLDCAAELPLIGEMWDGIR